MAQKDKKTNETDKESAFSDIYKKFKTNPLLYIGSVLILVLVIVTFLGGDLLSGGRFGQNPGDLTFGFYDRVPITYSPDNKFGQTFDQLSRQYRDMIDPNDIQMHIALWNAAFQNAAVHTAVLQELNRSNYEVPQQIINRETARLPHFQDERGFSRALWQQMPEAQRNVLMRQVREDYAAVQYYNELFSLLIPEGEAEFFGKMAADTRTFNLVSFLVDDFPELEYREFAEENPELFGTIHLSRILISSSEREAARILESVRNGEISFEDAARAQSTDFIAERGGDMGIRFIHELERDIPAAEDRRVILGLRRGEISEIINVDQDWVIYRVEGEFMPANLEDDLVMDRVRAYMRNYQRGRMEDHAIEQAEIFAREAANDGFEIAADRRNIEVFNIGPLPLNYGSAEIFMPLEAFPILNFSEQHIQDLARNPNFWRTAFSTQLNTPSAPIVHGANVFVLYPIEQEDVTEGVAEQTVQIYPSWIRHIAESTLQPYFMNHLRMDNQFWQTYSRLFQF